MAFGQFHRPETALAKARELIKCNKKANALEILFDVMRMRRSKIWQTVLEELMLLLVELCVELRKSLHFRKAIYQYRNISLLEYTTSFEHVVRSYLTLIKAKTDEAQQESKSMADIDDLDQLETPESIMLNAVSLEDAQDRSARTIVMPWLKFLWDSYRLALDLLRGNSKLERLYHEIANDAFDFCVKYSRKVEFRKLSEMLRSHTQKVQSHTQSNAPNQINLTDPETQSMHFETRLRQLDCAMELGMYTDAFKTIEDIWSFILVSKKATSALLMTNYYSKSAELFLRSGCHLYHAAALHKLLALYRDHKKNITREELSELGSRVLCATLAIPLPASFDTDRFLLSGDYAATKQKTLAGLLGLIQIPTRQSLVHDLIRHKVPTFVPSELAELCQVLENDFQPLSLWSSTSSAVDYMSTVPELKIYVEQMHDNVAARTILQLSQVYQTIKFDRVVELCPFMDRIRLERCIMELVRNLELPISLNHRLQSIVFDKFTDLGISQCDYGGQLVTSSTHVNAPDRLSRQLSMFAQVMHQITEMLRDEDQSVPTYRRHLLSQYRASADELRQTLLQRRDVIENRKEQMETYLIQQDQFYLDEEARRRAVEKEVIDKEEAKLQKEAEERERCKVEEEVAKLKRRVAREHLKVVASANIGMKDLTDEQLDKFNAEEILDQKSEEVKRKHKELYDKSKAMAKKIDYFERAARLEEIPLLQANIEPDAEAAREFFEKCQQEAEERSRLDHERSMKERDRLEHMKADVQNLVGRLKSARDTRFNARYAEWREECTAIFNERVAKRKAQIEAEAVEEARLEAEQEAEAMRLVELEAESEKRKQEEKAQEAAEREAQRIAEQEKQERINQRWSNYPADQNEKPEAQKSADQWKRGTNVIGGPKGLAAAATNPRGNSWQSPLADGNASQQTPNRSFEPSEPPKQNAWSRGKVLAPSSAPRGGRDGFSKPWRGSRPT